MEVYELFAYNPKNEELEAYDEAVPSYQSLDPKQFEKNTVWSPNREGSMGCSWLEFCTHRVVAKVQGVALSEFANYLVEELEKSIKVTNNPDTIQQLNSIKQQTNIFNSDRVFVTRVESVTVKFR